MPLPLALGALGAGGAGAAGGAGLLSAGLGLGSGIMSDVEKRKERKKAEKASRPERRRLTEIQQALQAYRETRLASQLTTAQAAMEWAGNLRI